MDGSLQNYLSRGRDGSLMGSLAAHDRRFHPQGFHDGDSCKFRDDLATGDLADSSVNDLNAGIDIFKNWFDGGIKVLSEKDAERAYDDIGDDVRYFITDAEQRFFDLLLTRYDNAVPEYDEDGELLSWKFGPRHINKYDDLIVMPRVPDVILDAFKADGVQKLPTDIRITPEVIEKILGVDKMSDVNARKLKKEEEYAKRKGIQGDHPELNNVHGITREDLRRLLVALDDPIAIYRRKSVGGEGGDGEETLTVLTEIVDRATGKRSGVPIRYVYRTQGGRAFLHVNTMFGRKDGNEIEQIQQSSVVYYLNRKKVAEILKSLPEKSGSGQNLGNSIRLPVGKIRTEADYSNSQLGKIISQNDAWCQSGSVRAFLGDDGRIAGWYDRKSGDTTLISGRANVKTVAHEIGWHATFHWAEKNMPELHDTLIQYAKDAPKAVVDSVIARYGEKLSPEALLDEIGAERFTRDHMGRIKDEIERRKTDGWWDDVEGGQKRLSAAFAKEEGKRVLTEGEMRQIASLPPSEAVARIVEEMLSGRSLRSSGKRERKFNAGDFKRYMGNGG